jgi:hypothetical protein
MASRGSAARPTSSGAACGQRCVGQLGGAAAAGNIAINSKAGQDFISFSPMAAKDLLDEEVPVFEQALECGRSRVRWLEACHHAISSIV